MSVKRRDLLHYLKSNGYYLLREGGKHSIYTNDIRWSGKKSLYCGADILSAQDIVAGGTPALQHTDHVRIIFIFCRVVIKKPSLLKDNVNWIGSPRTNCVNKLD